MGKQRLDVRTDGATEVLRVYRVLLERPDRQGDEPGEPCIYPVEVALRYSHAEADELAPSSPVAFDEAERRACVVERRDYGLGYDVPLYVVDGETRMVRTRTVPARIGTGWGDRGPGRSRGRLQLER